MWHYICIHCIFNLFPSVWQLQREEFYLIRSLHMPGIRVHSPRISTVYLALYQGLEEITSSIFLQHFLIHGKEFFLEYWHFFTKKLSISSSVSGLPYVLCWRQRYVNIVVIFWPLHIQKDSVLISAVMVFMTCLINCHSFLPMICFSFQNRQTCNWQETLLQWNEYLWLGSSKWEQFCTPM